MKHYGDITRIRGYDVTIVENSTDAKKMHFNYSPMEKIGDILNENPMGDSVFSIVSKSLKDEFNRHVESVFVETCIGMNIDPDIVKKQAELIRNLQEQLDQLGESFVGCRFKNYLELKEENDMLRRKIQAIKDTIGGEKDG